MALSRRLFLRGGLASAASLALTTPVLAAPALVGLKPLKARTLAFDCVQTGEKYKPVDYWVEGEYVPDALSEIDRAMRDFMSGEVHPIERKLVDLIHHLGRTFETDCRFELICGYRSPATNETLRNAYSGVAKQSLHLNGKAADIALPGVSLAKLHEAALAMKVGGVGYYPEPNFIHVDVGRVRRWVG